MPTPLLLIVSYACAAAVVMLLGSLLSGWFSMAETYRGRLASVSSRVWMGSGHLNRFGIPAVYRNCLIVAVGSEGVQLSLFPLFALGSPPLLIPWSDLGSCRRYKALGLFDRFSFRPVLSDVQITLAGSAARMVGDEVARGAIRRSLAVA